MNTEKSEQPESLDFEHTRRQVLDEAHKRPFMTINAPCRITHLVYLSDKDGDAGAGHLQELLKQSDQSRGKTLVADDSCQFGYFPEFTLRWERHTEFSTYTLITPGSGANHFNTDSALANVPQDWLDNIPGQQLAAFHILITTDLNSLPGSPDLNDLFAQQSV
jgi:uncharacterized membrane-anchored protein